jgi:Hemerythrin HHE cation binding domain
MDITQLILDDHHEQRRRFALLEQIDSANGRALADVWARLAVFLEVHAAAEEEIFYPELVKLAVAPRPLASAEPETLDAIYDHNEIRDAIAAVRPHRVGSPEWREAVAAANRANGDHMAEEEREGLTDFRRRVSLAERHDLAVRFATFEARNFAGVRPVDKDPQEYVREQEAAARAGISAGVLLDGSAGGDDADGDGADGSVRSPGSLGIGGLKH